MSTKLMETAYEIDLPPTEKAVLVRLAWHADDEMGKAWPSIASLVKATGFKERAVQLAIKALAAAKHIKREEVQGLGVRYFVHPRTTCTPQKGVNGGIAQVDISGASTPAPHAPRMTCAPAPGASTPAPHAPKQSRTVIPKKDKPSLVAHEIPDDWEPRPFGETTKSRKVVDGWPPGELEYQLEHFRAHHRKKGDRFKSWQDAWSTWVLNARSFGGQSGRTNGMGRHQPDDGLSQTRRAALRVFGPPAGDQRPVPG